MKKGVYLILLVLLLPFVYAEDYVNSTVGDSTGDSVAVVDDVRPEVTVVNPIDGDMLAGEVIVQAVATDNVAIDKVEFVLDGVVVSTAFEPNAEGMYEWFFDTSAVDDGLHALVVAPYDEAGNFNDFSTIQITVANAVVAAPASAVGESPVAVSASAVGEAPVDAPVEVPQAIPRVAVERAPDVVDSKQPLWQTLLMSFVAVVVVSGVLFMGVSRLRSLPEVPEHIKVYVYSSMQQGYPTTAIRSALLQQGWDDNVVEEAFKSAIEQHQEVGF